MKLILSKDVKGISKSHEERLHASAGDVLCVLLLNDKGYICDSLNYPNEHVIVFKSQALEIIEEKDDTPDNEEGLTSESVVYDEEESE